MIRQDLFKSIAVQPTIRFQVLKRTEDQTIISDHGCTPCRCRAQVRLGLSIINLRLKTEVFSKHIILPKMANSVRVIPRSRLTVKSYRRSNPPPPPNPNSGLTKIYNTMLSFELQMENERQVRARAIQYDDCRSPLASRRTAKRGRFRLRAQAVPISQ